MVGVKESPRLSNVIVDTILAGKAATTGLRFFATFLADLARVDLRRTRLDFFGFQLQSPLSKHKLVRFNTYHIDALTILNFSPEAGEVKPRIYRACILN